MVTVYTSPGCQHCARTKSTLKNLGVDYEEIDVTESPEKADRLRQLGFSQLPVVMTDSENWSGFDKEKLEKLQ